MIYFGGIVLVIIVIFFCYRVLKGSKIGIGNIKRKDRLLQTVEQIEQEVFQIPQGASETVVLMLYKERISMIDSVIHECEEHTSSKNKSVGGVSGTLQERARKKFAAEMITRLNKKKTEATLARDKALGLR